MSVDTFQVVTHPAAPANCRTCGSPYGLRPLIDTGLTGDFCNRPHWDPVNEEVNSEIEINTAGAVYFCESCVINMGMVVGMLPQHKVAELNSQLEQQDNMLQEFNTRIDALEKILDGYTSLDDLNRRSNGYHSSVGMDVVEVSSPESLAENFTIIGISDDESENPDASESGESISPQSNLGNDDRDSETDELTSGEKSDGVSPITSGESGERGDEQLSTKLDTESRIGF